MFETQQLYSDKLDQIVLKNALMASKNKLLVTNASGFDVDDLRDWSKEVHTGESLNGITWFSTPPLPAYITNYIQLIRAGIKEESGANDFSRGTTNSGVTAASAIAALQEMSAKRSRMAARQMHASYKDAVRMEIEVEREYNLLPREVMISKDGKQVKATFESSKLFRKTRLGNTVPIEFMVSIKVQKENRWTQMAHNELIMQMVKLGVIKPDEAVELMQFEGRESILSRIKKAAEGINKGEPEAMPEALSPLPASPAAPGTDKARAIQLIQQIMTARQAQQGEQAGMQQAPAPAPAPTVPTPVQPTPAPDQSATVPLQTAQAESDKARTIKLLRQLMSARQAQTPPQNTGQAADANLKPGAKKKRQSKNQN